MHPDRERESTHYEWICKFIHQGIVKSPKYGQRQHHVLNNFVYSVVKNLLPNICKDKYTRLDKSVSYPTIPNVRLSVMCNGNGSC